MAKTERRSTRSQSKVKWEFPLEAKNLKIIALGLIIILIGYGLMYTGIGGEYAAVEGTWNNPLAVNIAPLVLVIGYCVVIPFGILKKFKKEDSEQN